MDMINEEFMIEYMKLRQDYRFQSVYRGLSENVHYIYLKENPHYPTLKMIMLTNPCWIIFHLMHELQPNAIDIKEEDRGRYENIRQKWIQWFNGVNIEMLAGVV
jgi:hypothetical protein